MSEVDYPLHAEHVPRPSDAQLMLPLPPQPKSLRETGLERQLVVELIAKAIFSGGKTHLSVLATRLRLSINVLREVLDFMVGEQLAEVAWRGDSDIDVQYQLTGPGKQRAAAFIERCANAGGRRSSGWPAMTWRPCSVAPMRDRACSICWVQHCMRDARYYCMVRRAVASRPWRCNWDNCCMAWWPCPTPSLSARTSYSCTMRRNICRRRRSMSAMRARRTRRWSGAAPISAGCCAGVR